MPTQSPRQSATTVCPLRVSAPRITSQASRTVGLAHDLDLWASRSGAGGDDDEVGLFGLDHRTGRLPCAARA